MVKAISIGFASVLCCASLILPKIATAQDNPNYPSAHSKPWPNIASGQSPAEQAASMEGAPQLKRAVPIREIVEQRRRLDAQLSAIQPQRPGVVDAFVISVALDSDLVFAREAREAARVLENRYQASGRVLTLAGPDGVRNDLAKGSIEDLFVALFHVATVMDTSEDVLVLYTTSHGNKLGLAYHYGDTGYGILSPARLKSVLEELGIERRILIISACHSGVFVPALSSRDTAILTASASQRNSFGCKPENDWTFFGDALINRELRKPQSLNDAARAASLTIAGWEAQQRLLASLPQSAFGAGVSDWLAPLEAGIPKEVGEPVGRPSVAE
ncbi:peptidase C13 [Erythrobacter longus]|uniref:Peptidase C13 n=1 Tax=Erythrobacter longus TaxID=1044 RepID=A0A074N161_ERYLO|nr:C13 family peptidase [Erythrobacter longus]KEO91622.1 peptidase C13 [Erythrobacter longus]